MPASPVAISGCASLLDDGDMVRQERSEVANRCVAWLLGEDAKPLPAIYLRDEMPWHPELGYVPGFYSPSRNMIVIQKRFNQGPILRLEIGHVYGVNEVAARSLARPVGACVNFGLM